MATKLTSWWLLFFNDHAFSVALCRDLPFWEVLSSILLIFDDNDTVIIVWYFSDWAFQVLQILGSRKHILNGELYSRIPNNDTYIGFYLEKIFQYVWLYLSLICLSTIHPFHPIHIFLKSTHFRQAQVKKGMIFLLKILCFLAVPHSVYKLASCLLGHPSLFIHLCMRMKCLMSEWWVNLFHDALL